MQIAQVLAGYTRQAGPCCGKPWAKNPGDPCSSKPDTFLKGCKREGRRSENRREGVLISSSSSAAMGSTRARASAYGLVSYQTAFLQANYLVEFMTAVLTSEIGHSALGSKEVGSKSLLHGQRGGIWGLRSSPPECRRRAVCFPSRVRPRPRKGQIRSGCWRSERERGAVESILAAQACGPFESLDDFARVDTRQTNRRCWSPLIKSGAFDRFPVRLGEESEELRMSELTRWQAPPV